MYHVQADPRSLATTYGISVDFFSSGYLDGSVLQVRFTWPMYSVMDTMITHGGFPHSDIVGSKLYCQLPHAFRRLTRPSSPVIAKASTWCTYSLDSIISRTYWLCLLWGLTPLHLLKFLLWQSLLLLCVSHTPFVSFVWATSIQSPNIYFWFRVAANSV